MGGGGINIFCNLHVHSANSVMDSINKVEDIAARCKELGQPAFAITDHGTVSGLIQGYQEAQKLGLHYVFGSEFYFVPDVTVKDRGNHHLIILAKNQVGYKNLLKLTSAAHRNMYYKPRIDYAILREHAEGLIATSACLGGIMNAPNSEEILKWFKSLFGENFYLELQTNVQEEQIAFNQQLVELAEKYTVPLTIATDAHYLTKEQANIHRKWTFCGEGDYYSTDDYWLMSEADVRKQVGYLEKAVIDEAIANTEKIAMSCEVTIPFGEKHYPVFPVADKTVRIKELCLENWAKIKNTVYDGDHPRYLAQLAEEQDVLAKADYEDLILLVHDLIGYCRQEGIRIGPGRGSSVGSLTCYLLGITKIDPLEKNLLFSRFCNLDRITPADIDLDFPRSKREKVLTYIREKWGIVYQARTHNYLGLKGAFQRAGQALKVQPYLIDANSKKLSKLDDIKNFADIPAEMYEVTEAFTGLINNHGVHASAIVLFPDEPENWTAIERRGENYVTSYDFGDLEQMGLIKFDLLGLNTLDLLDNCLELIKEPIDIDNLEDCDEKTYTMLGRGETAGVFQMESSGMARLCKNIEPWCHEDLTALNALYRPGPLESGMVDEYLANRKKRVITYPHPALEKILDETYGVMAYQEQIMKIPQELCGWTQGQGDILRRAISKKKQGVMDELLPKFIEDGITRGIDSELMEDLADKIVLFANYGFNKCISGRERIFRRQNGRYHPTIEEMYLIKNNQCYYSSVKKTSLHEKYCRHGYGAALSMGMDGRLKLNRIVDIYYSGTMPVYRLTTSRGCTAECTLNHALPTPKGKKTLKELTVGDEIYINGGYEVQRGNYNWYHSPPPPNTPVKGQKGFQQRTDGNSSQFWAIRDFYKNMLLPCEKCGKTNARYQLHHIDENRENNSPENLLWLCDGCHKKIHYKIGRTKSFGKGLAAVLDKIVSIEYVCDERTYDIEVEAPNHNLLLNGGVIVANSHSSAYAWLAYQTAYLKAHYPLEFHCALLNSELGNSEKTAEYVEEVSRLGIKVLPPDVFASKHVWTIEGEALRCGLGCIKGVGSKINFVTEGVTSASDFLKKNWHKNKKALENLIKAGALGGEKKKELIAQVSWLKDYNSRLEEINNKIEDYQEKVDKWTGEKIKHTQTTPTLEIPPGDEEQWEREMLGFTLRDTFANYDISLALTHRDITAGELIKFKRHIDKKGGTMAFLKIKDYEGMIRELVMFSSYFRPLTEGKVYLLKVKETSVIDVTEAKRKPGG